MTALGTAFALGALWLAMRLAPETPTARLLHRWLVEAPARRLAAVRQGTVIAILLAVALAATAWAIDEELLRVLAMAAPEAGAWLSMVEVGTLVDIGVAALAGRAAVQVGAVRALLPRRRARRVRRRPRPPAANDADDPALAA